MSAEHRLPIPDKIELQPVFRIDDLLDREDETGRVECTFSEIQDFLQARTEHIIPTQLAMTLSRMGRWQLIHPNTFDLSQILFIGKASYPRDYIPIAEAEATIYFHRGAEDWSHAPGTPYTDIWKMELASVFPDSNGDPRLLAIYYRLHIKDGDFSSQSMLISIRSDELRGREKESDTVWGPVLETPQTFQYDREPPFMHPCTTLGVGIITEGMLNLTDGHRRVFVAPFFGMTRVTKTPQGSVIDTSSPKNEQDPARDRGIYKAHEKGIWEIGLDAEGSTTPWVLSVPDFLEKPIRPLSVGTT